MQKQAAPISIRGRLFFCGERSTIFVTFQVIWEILPNTKFVKITKVPES